jgi:hypothetical protein
MARRERWRRLALLVALAAAAVRSVCASQAAADVAAQPERGIAVRVLRGMSDEPAPGALVEVGEVFSDDSATSLAALVRADTFAGAPIQPRRRYRADADGRLRVPFPVIAASLSSTEDGELGCAVVFHHQRASEIALRLLPDPPLSVRVVDAAGEPVAGAEVAIFRDAERCGTVAAGDDGVATVRRVRAYAAGAEPAPWIEGVPVRAGELTRDPRLQRIDLRTADR